MEILFGVVAVSALAGLTGLRLASSWPAGGLVAVLCSVAGLCGVGIGMVPTFNHLKTVEQAYENDKVARQEEGSKILQCDADRTAAAGTLAKLTQVHRHLTQGVLGLDLPQIAQSGSSTYEQMSAILASIEAASAADDLGRVREAFARVPAELQRLGLVLDETPYASGDRAAKIGMIAEVLRRVKSPALCEAPSSAATRIRERLSRPVEAPLYRIDKLSSSEVVRTLRGDWYNITLRSARAEQLVSFNEPSYYTLSDDVEAEVRRSITALWADIIVHLPVSRRMFVRGRSDQRSWSGPLQSGDENATVLIHQGSEKTGYDARPIRTSLAVNNAHLPNWRGRYLRSIMPDVAVLAGELNTKAAGDLLLFVDWSKSE